jgi:UPF0755 protein
MKKAALFFLLLALAILGLTLAPASSSQERVEVSIPAGSGSAAIARSLKQAGALRSTLAFRAACILSGRGRKLQAGDYEVPKNLNAWQLSSMLVSGKALQHHFLIPEGAAAFQIAKMLEARKLANGKRFLELVRSPAFAKKMGVDGNSLEGYLFPDSYQFVRGIPEETLISMMLTRFREMVPPSLLSEGAALNLKPRQVLTLASLVEKEAKVEAERPKVARVFLNRRRAKKRLESCATVRFALDKYTGPVLFKDLEVESPYNTYRHYDLPPGPICSPGLKAIEAAAHPAEGKWMFFVVAGDGSQVFSETFEEHKKAKLRYKRLKKGVVEE